MANFTPEFTAAQITRFEQLRAFYGPAEPNFTKREMAHLLFMRWMWENGRLEASAGARMAANRVPAMGPKSKAGATA